MVLHNLYIYIYIRVSKIGPLKTIGFRQFGSGRFKAFSLRWVRFGFKWINAVGFEWPNP